MKKVLIFLSFLLIFSSCSKEESKLNEDIKKRYDYRNEVISLIGELDKEDGKLQGAFEGDVNDPSGNNLEKHMEEYRKVFEKFTNKRSQLIGAMDYEIDRDLDDLESKVFREVDRMYDKLKEEIEKVDLLFDEKIKVIGELSNLLKEENPKEVDVSRLIMEINDINKGENDLYIRINDLIDQLDEKNMEYDKYLKEGSN